MNDTGRDPQQVWSWQNEETNRIYSLKTGVSIQDHGNSGYSVTGEKGQDLQQSIC